MENVWEEYMSYLVTKKTYSSWYYFSVHFLSSGQITRYRNPQKDSRPESFRETELISEEVRGGETEVRREGEDQKID